MNKSIPLLLLSIFPWLTRGQTLETVIQKGHELAVVTVVVSPDSTLVATGSRDKSIKLWEISTGRELRSLLGHEMTVTSIAFSPDGKMLLSGSNDRSLRLWDVFTGQEVFSLATDDFITDVAIDPKMRFFASAGYNKTGYPDSASIYDFNSKEVIRKIPINADEGRGFGVALAISNDGQWIGFGEDNRQVNIYETTTWKKVHTFQYEEGWCGGCSTMITFHPDNKSAFMASHKGPLKKYDLATGDLLKVYEEKSADLTGIALSHDGKLLARATETNATIWDQATGTIVSTTDAVKQGQFHRIVFARNNEVLFITSDDNTAFGWNFKANRTDLVLTGMLNTRDKGGLNYDPNFYWQSAIAKYVRLKNSLLLSKDGKTLVKGKFGTKVKQWDIASGKTVMEFSGHAKAVLCYDLSADGRRLVTGGGDGRIILWDFLTGDSIKVIRTYREPVFDIHFNSDESQVLSSSWDATMKIHDLATGKLLSYFEFESYAAYNVLFHPNDLYIVSARLDNSIQLWEIDTRTAVRNFVGHTDVVSALRLSPDQKMLLSASWDGSIRLWDIGTGLMAKKLKGHHGAVLAAIFSPDGKYIYSAGADRCIRVWDVATSKEIKTIRGHNAEITAVILSPDNKMLISHSVDGVTKFYDLQSGQEFFEHIHLGENDWMVKNPSGFFNGTDNSRKYIHFVDGLKSYAVDQFFNDFFRPELLPEIFRQRGTGPQLKGIQGKLSESPPPSVKLAIIPTVPGKAELHVRATDNGAGVQNLRIFHNGKNIPLRAGSFESSKPHLIYRQELDLVSGSNQFSATASNRDRLDSDLQTAEIFSDHVSRNSTCHVLAVGINRYKNPKMTLNYARPDADSFSRLMDEKGVRLFKALAVHTLYDEEASRSSILKKLDELAAIINPEDVFIFYYAGHGSMVDNQFYFIPSEAIRLYDAGTLEKDAIEAGVLHEKLKHISALKQLIIMDACQSGASVELLANRGVGEEKAIAQLSRSAGIHVMASAGSEQFAAEFTQLGHGLFTYVLIQALQGEADGAPRDGKVTIYELKSYIDDQVPELTRKLKGKPQYPYTFSRGQDFPIVLQQ